MTADLWALSANDDSLERLRARAVAVQEGIQVSRLVESIGEPVDETLVSEDAAVEEEAPAQEVVAAAYTELAPEESFYGRA